MYAAIRRYNVAPGSADQIVQRINESFLPRISQMPGFIAYYVVNPGDGTIVSVSVFGDRAGAEASTRASTDWVRENLAHLIRTAPVIVTGDVVAQAVAPGAMSPTSSSRA
jgi:heme-degrading monooxygenase HmoA